MGTPIKTRYCTLCTDSISGRTSSDFVFYSCNFITCPSCLFSTIFIVAHFFLVSFQLSHLLTLVAGNRKDIGIGVPDMVHWGGKTKFAQILGNHPQRPRSSAVGARIEAPPPQKIFPFLSSKRRVLVHLWCYFLQMINLNLHIQIAKTFI